MTQKHKFFSINGYKFIIIHNSKFATSTIGLTIKVGSANDAKGRNGIANLLQTLILTCSENTNRLQLIYDLGGYVTASTEKEHTSYLIEYIDHTYLNSMLVQLINIIANKKFTDEELELARSVVLNKIYTNHGNIEELVNDIIHEQSFSKQTLAKRKEGRIRTVKLTTLQNALTFHNKYYNKKNMAIIIASNEEIHDIISKIQLVAPHIVPLVHSSGTQTAFKKYLFKPKYKHLHKNMKGALCALALKSPGFKDYSANSKLQIFQEVLTNGYNAILRKFTQFQPICRTITYNSVSIVIILLKTTCDYTNALMNNIISAIKSTKIDERTIKSAINHITNVKRIIHDKSKETVIEFMNHFLHLRKMKKHNFDMEILQSTSIESINEYIKQITRDDNIAQLVIGPRLLKSKVSSIINTNQSEQSIK